MKRWFTDWTRLALIILPLAVIIFDAAVLYGEWRQPDSEKAVRLVRESKSRKENFTVQQYLYATVYHRQQQGEAISIEGWRVEPDASEPERAAGPEFLVSFTYTDAGGQHRALWKTNLRDRHSTVQNQEAAELSWQ